MKRQPAFDRFREKLTQRRSPERAFLATVLAILGALWLFAILAGDVMNREPAAIDEAGLRFFRQAHDLSLTAGPPWLRGVMLDYSALGGGGVLTLLVLLAAGYLLLRRRRGEALLVLISSLGGAVLSNVLKEIFQRGRPSVVPHLAEVMTMSFPSGHSMHSAVIYLTLGALLARNAPDRRTKIYFLSVALFLPLLIGVTRVYAGVHYPTDVLGGWCAGLVWALICYTVAQRMRRPPASAAVTSSRNPPPETDGGES